MGPPLEESLIKELGADMASHNGYANIPGYGLYDTTGGTEDWTYGGQGSFGFTIEIGPPGPVTREIQGVFEDALCGRDARYADWLDLVPVPSQA